MKRRGRVRRVAKWAGLAVCVLIAAASVLNRWWAYNYIGVGSGGRIWVVKCTCGVIAFADSRTDTLMGWPWETEVFLRGSKAGWYSRRASWGYVWRPGWLDGPSGVSCWLPLWIPFLGLAVPTACLWWRDRRVRAGHCAACGYDLAGLGDGAACPECGGAGERGGSAPAIKV